MLPQVEDTIEKVEDKEEQKLEEKSNDMHNNYSESSPRDGEGPSENKDEDNRFPRISSHQICLPQRYKYYALMSSVLNVIEPMNFNEANEHEVWRKAMKEEFDSLMKNKMWPVKH